MMMRPLFAVVGLVLVLALAASACGEKEQSFADGMRHLCGSTASLPSTMSRSEKASAIGRAADKNVKNPEVRALIEKIVNAESGKSDMLRAAAARAGIERCGLLELWTESPLGKSLRIICEAPDKLPVPPEASQSERAQAMADYIRANVTDPDALKLMGELATIAPEARGAHLASVARANGIERCPLAEMP
jgi:hypothetical protein